ncbi:CD109 antigen-like [Hyperolius riggenbachi]|uniref:CD109 antigen-like n=1 Tax=Hyperolius riggenbachi TaxID=752182 RepID=UPI0035A2F24D
MNTSLAVHWFGQKYPEIIVNAGIAAGSNILVNASKLFAKVLPKFSVKLDVPSVYVVPKKLNLTGTVTAKYLSNKPLQGNLTITVKPYYSQSKDINETYQVSGSVNFSFAYAEIQNIIYLEGLNITASVTDQFTGFAVETSSYVRIINSEYEITFIDQQPPFLSGGNYTSKMQIKSTDGKPLTEEERKENVTVRITHYMTSSTETNEQQYVIPENGTINVQFMVDPSLQRVNIMAIYQSFTENVNITEVLAKNPFVQIQTPDSLVKVVSRGLVVAAGKNRTTFSLTPENSWTPSAQINVYLIDDKKGIMQISKTFDIKRSLGNKVELSWSKATADPSKPVSLLITVKESRSLVGLRIADKRPTFADRRNDLTSSRVASPPHTVKTTELHSEESEPVFTEIWTWLETNVSSSLKSSLQLTVPDRNATWVATAFVLSAELGLGIADDEPVELSVYKPFEVSMYMPHSVTRGETFILEVTLSNSLTENLQILLTLETSDLFDTIIPIDNNNFVAMVASQRRVTVPSRDELTVRFPVKPKTLGNITLTVKATSNAASETASRSILVKAEGVKHFFTQAEVFELTTSGNSLQTMSKNFSFSFPSDVVEGSEEAFITVTGDLLGPSIPSLAGFHSLIQMPYGCGEQNMINFAPNLYILQYLISSHQITEEIKEKTVNFMQLGYQKELTYKRYDGSFSAFGNDDTVGSTWLSAFIFRCFLQAREFIYISPDILSGTVQWLVQYQNMNTGEFSEPGRVIHKELQGGQNGPITLTAYIVTSLLEDETYRNLYIINIQKGVAFIEKKFDEGITSNYTLSVVAYALSLANSSKAAAALNQLGMRADGTAQVKFWSSPSKATNYYWQPRTTDIETAAYALLSYSQQNRIVDGIPVMKWLSLQRSHLGGYGSTQDTLMALQALSKFMIPSSSSNTLLSMTITGTGMHMPKQFQINKDNIILLQSHKIEVTKSLMIIVTASGTGLGIVQLNVAYNRESLSSRRRRSLVSEAFTLDVSTKEDTGNIHRVSVNICTQFQGMGNESGMAILDVGLLSGFTMKTNDFIKPKSLKLVETQNDKVYLYFDSLTKDKLCISVPMVRSAEVASSQDAVIKVYDYYMPEMMATRTYNSLTMKRISPCDFCGFNCSLCRSNILVIPRPQTSSASAPAVLIMLWLSVISVCSLLPSFYIIIPRSIISNEDTRLAVHWFGNYSEVLVTATLRPAHDRADVLVKSEIFYNDTVGILTLPALTGNISSEYYLTIEGYQENGTIFSSEYMLETIWRNISLYIQTNKMTYRPGDTVKLRVVAVDHELQPYNKLINVNVMDPDENIIHQWAKRKLNLGVVTLEMVLAKYSMTGSWKIQAVTQDFSSIEYFVVDEGVLPKFDVTLKAPFVYIDSKKTDISGIVTAKYPSGKPVAGTVSIFVTPTYIYGNSYKVNKTFEISGSVNFNFNYTELVNVMMWGSANITATVTEELTGIKLNATSQITRSYYEYTFILKDRYGQFIPDTNYTAKWLYSNKKEQRSGLSALSQVLHFTKVATTMLKRQ